MADGRKGRLLGILDWLLSFFRQSVPTRDISRLGGSDPSVTEEVIDEAGGPLKPDHRRVVVRDKRLLPKPRSKKVTPSVWPRSKRPKVMPSNEARRLFSETMRTRDREVRLLATDEEQLRRYDLPVWKHEADIATALGLTESQLRHFSIHRQRETTPHYVTFAVPKRSGGHRLIQAPKRRLKKIQRDLKGLLVDRLPVSPYAHGFRKGRSVATNARQHAGKAVVIKLDIKDCFPSIHYGRIRGLFVSFGYSYPVATTLAVVMTESVRQPVVAEGKTYHVPVGPRVCVQGAPTSPGLCNAIMMRMDRRLAGLAQKFGFNYSRYADDLAFSGDDLDRPERIIRFATQIIQDEGFEVNSRKTRVLRCGSRQQVTGVVVNHEPSLSRVERRRLRAAIHQLNAADIDKVRAIAGRLAYLQMINPRHAEPLRLAFLAKTNTS